MKKLISKWYLVIVFGFIIFAGLVFLLCGENSIIAVHDNLDLFIPQFQMMKNTGTFWTHGEMVPFLGGISRDNLPAEFSLYTILYMILPSYWAYITGYILKILIALGSCILLSKELYGEKYTKYKPLVYLVGFSYGILNLFPAFGIPFASIPLVIWLFIKVYRRPSWKWYLGLFLYPVLSYFSYFGLFILGYMVLAFLWIWMRDRKFPGRLLLGIAVLAAGCIVCEYRLFGLMLLGGEETIRSTIVAGNMSAEEIVQTTLEVFTRGMFHAESMHTWLILPVCAIYFLVLNFSYIRNKNVRGIFHDLFNLLALILIFNSVVYGIYYWEGFRNLVETLCPPLTGWQFNRTVFFSPFIWYGAFFLVLKRLYDNGKKLLVAGANLLAVAAALLIIFSDTRYNDFYHTCVNQVYSIVKDKQSDQLSYGEFYSEELFEEAKEDLGYSGQWSMAYGFYPAILEYNDIYTLDGYLGFYSQYYKDEFRKVIAPALDRVEESRIYFDEWGARAYLYSGTDVSIVNSSRNYAVTDRDIYIDLDAFKALGGRYIFSRIELTNAKETGLVLAGTYTHEKSPYTLYVYQTATRYQTRDEQEVTYDEMKMLTYDRAVIDAALEELEALTAQAQENGGILEPEKVVLRFEEMENELNKMVTVSGIAELEYSGNMYNQDYATRQQEIYEELVYVSDAAYTVLGELCRSPYKETMETVLDPDLVEGLAEYEELSEREKELSLTENSLMREYEQAAGMDYSFTYQGEEWNYERLMTESGTLSEEDNIALYIGVSKARNDVLGEMFLDLVELRTEYAQLKGYDNYAEYAYNELYIRDYSLEDTKSLFREIKRKVVPAFGDIEDVYYSMDFSSLFYLEDEMTQDELLEAIYPYIEEIDEDLGQSLSHLMDCGLYDMTASDQRVSGGFTLELPYYQDAFIFVTQEGSYWDYTTAIHEFGHYNQAYHEEGNILESYSNLDVGEIHSQGLEMLFYDYYDDIFEGEEGELCAFMQVYSMASATIEMALLSEFEIEAYENPDMTLEELNKLYLDLSQQYGIYYVDEITEVYTWSDLGHVFTSPCYCISYTTAAFSSLDLLNMSMQDKDAAIETYMELTALPSYVPYCSAIEYVGLQDIFERGTAGDIMQETRELLDLF